MRKALHVASLVVLLAGLGGCIEFEKQTILLRWDREKDVLHARLIYEGIFADAGDLETLEKQFKELQKTAERGTRFFLLDNWPLDFDVGEPEEGETDRLVNRLIRPFITVKNGTFYLNAEGRLSAWQDLEIKPAKEFLTVVNRSINLAVLAGQVRELKDADAKTKTFSKMAALGNHEWVTIDEEGVLSLRFFASDEDAVKLKRFALGRVPAGPEEAEAPLAVAVVEVKPMRPGGDGAKDGDAKDGDAKKAGGDGAKDGDAKKADGDGAKDGDVVEEDAGAMTEREAVLRFVSENRLEWSHRGAQIVVSLVPDAKHVLKLQHWNRGRYVPNLLEPDPTTGKKPPELPLPLRRDVATDRLIATFAE